MRIPKHGALAVAACSLLLTLPLAAAAGKKARKAPNPHAGWANPQGVLVSTDGGRVKAPEKKDPDDEDSPPPASNGELEQLAKALSSSFSDCLATMREAALDLQKGGVRYAFTLDFVIASDGRVGSMAQTKRGGSRELPACATAVRDQVASHVFAPTGETQALEAHLEYEAVILSDSDAQGRGYQYIAAEKAWEAALKSNKAWFQCNADDDCRLTAEMCEVRAISRTQLDAYRAAISTRRKPPCYAKIDLDRYQVSCRSKRCISRKGTRRP